MKSVLVPALTTPWSTPLATSRVRDELQRANTELASGRHADMGLQLGGRAKVLVSAQAQKSLLEGARNNAGIGAARLATVQQSLATAVSGAQRFMEELVPQVSGQGDAAQGAALARSLLGDFTSAVNATSQGAFVFAGKNITAAPLAEYFSDPPSAARQAVESAFQAKFGMAPSDPAAASIAPADMQDFLDNEFAALFDSPQWEALWSSATDEGLRNLVSLSDVAQVTASANDPAIRKVAMAYVMMAGLGVESLGGATRQVVAENALQATGEGVAQLNAMQGQVGVVEERIGRAQERLDSQLALVDRQIAGMEQVDLHEAAEKVQALSLQLEASYAATGKLKDLTLLRYL